MKRRLWIRYGLLIASPFLIVKAYLAFIHLNNNFHTVIPGELYRSAQPSADNVMDYARLHGIKTIINLRGENYPLAWYRDALAAAATQGIKVLDFRMSSHRMLTPEQTNQLITLMREAPKPLLIHCRAGSDRTGLASALYMDAVKHASAFDTRMQLSIMYGHLSLPFINEYAMDRTLFAYNPSLGDAGSSPEPSLALRED